jgi:transcriptional antiterminator RfaH
MTLDPQPHTRLDARHNDRGASLDPAPMSSGSRWFCAWTHPSAEFRSELDLMAKGFRVYLPLHLDRRFERDAGQAIIGPLFPRYLFVQFNPSRDQWRRIYRSRGIAGLIAVTTDKPIPVPIGIIEHLQARTSARRVVDDPGEHPEASRIRVGATGTVLGGPWAGWTGICTLSRRDRLTLLLSLFGRQVPVSLRHDQVIAA